MSTEPQRGALLGINDLAAVQDAIHTCRSKWYNLGLQLGVDEGTLRSFEKDYRHSDDQLREVITTWLKTSKNPTWGALADALNKHVIGEANLAREIQQRYCSKGQPPVHDAPIPGESRVHEMIDKRMKGVPDEKRVDEMIDKRMKGVPDEKRVHEMIDERMKVEKLYCNSAENIQFLDILKKLGKLEEVYHLVTSCEVLTEKQCVKLVGTREECQQAERKIDLILLHSERLPEPLPVFVSSAVGKYATRCMAENEGVLVLPREKKIMFIAEDREHCRKAIEWMQANAYPFALQFKQRGRYFLTTSKLSGDTPVDVKAVGHPCYIMKLKQVIQGRLPLDSDTLYKELKSIFEKLEPYQTKLKVGYEARFGHILWKIFDEARTRRDGSRKKWTLDYFRNPPMPFNSVFRPGVHPDIQKVLSRCCPVTTDDGHSISSIKLLDPVKLTVTRHDGTEDKCVAVIEEIVRDSGSRFILNNVFYNQRAKGTPQFDIVLPEKKYDVRIAPNFAPSVEQYANDKEYEEVHKITDNFRSSIHRRRSDNTLWMKVRGPNYQVTFLRQKEQTQYKYEKWILAVYNVQQFEIPDKEFKRWQMDKQEQIPLKEPKMEIELWNQKWFGDFAHRAQFTGGQYAPVRSTADMQLPDEDTPRKGSHWTTGEMMKDFGEFLDAAVSITDLLTQDV